MKKYIPHIIIGAFIAAFLAAVAANACIHKAQEREDRIESCSYWAKCARENLDSKEKRLRELKHVADAEARDRGDVTRKTMLEIEEARREVERLERELREREEELSAAQRGL